MLSDVVQCLLLQNSCRRSSCAEMTPRGRSFKQWPGHGLCCHETGAAPVCPSPLLPFTTWASGQPLAGVDTLATGQLANNAAFLMAQQQHCYCSAWWKNNTGLICTLSNTALNQVSPLRYLCTFLCPSHGSLSLVSVPVLTPLTPHF